MNAFDIAVVESDFAAPEPPLQELARALTRGAREVAALERLGGDHVEVRLVHVDRRKLRQGGGFERPEALIVEKCAAIRAAEGGNQTVVIAGGVDLLHVEDRRQRARGGVGLNGDTRPVFDGVYEHEVADDIGSVEPPRQAAGETVERAVRPRPQNAGRGQGDDVGIIRCFKTELGQLDLPNAAFNDRRIRLEDKIIGVGAAEEAVAVAVAGESEIAGGLNENRCTGGRYERASPYPAVDVHELRIAQVRQRAEEDAGRRLLVRPRAVDDDGRPPEQPEVPVDDGSYGVQNGEPPSGHDGLASDDEGGAGVEEGDVGPEDEVGLELVERGAAGGERGSRRRHPGPHQHVTPIALIRQLVEDEFLVGREETGAVQCGAERLRGGGGGEFPGLEIERELLRGAQRGVENAAGDVGGGARERDIEIWIAVVGSGKAVRCDRPFHPPGEQGDRRGRGR